MGTWNQATVIGNVTRDCELKYTTSGAAVANLTVVTNDVWTDKSGQRQEKAQFHRVVIFGKSAESLAEFLKRGKQVAVIGRLQTREWEKDGQKRFSTAIVGDRIVLLGSSAANETSGRLSASATSGDELTGDDIPF
jgi:single-strand DNA-binding protein